VELPDLRPRGKYRKVLPKVWVAGGNMAFCGSAEKGIAPKGRYGELDSFIVGQETVKEKYRFGLKEKKKWNIYLLDDRKSFL